MDNFDYKKKIKNNPLLQEEVQDNGPEEKAFDTEFDTLGDQLAGAIKGELKGKEEKLDEVAGVVGIIGYILLSNTVANMLAKFVKKQATKRDWGTGKEAAEKIGNIFINRDSLIGTHSDISGEFVKKILLNRQCLY